MVIECEFLADLRSELRSRLRSEGYDVPSDDDPDEVVRWWFTTRARSIPRQKRAVVRSKQLQTRRDLPEEERDSVRRIEMFARKGKNLNHFLSRKRLDADFNDALFVSWKILHVHLGRPSGGRVASTSRLLFARVEAQKMYLERDLHRPAPLGGRITQGGAFDIAANFLKSPSEIAEPKATAQTSLFDTTPIAPPQGTASANAKPRRSGRPK